MTDFQQTSATLPVNADDRHGQEGEAGTSHLFPVSWYCDDVRSSPCALTRIGGPDLSKSEKGNRTCPRTYGNEEGQYLL